MLEEVHALLRKDVPAHHGPLHLAPDIAHATQLVREGAVAKLLKPLGGLPKLWIPG